MTSNRTGCLTGIAVLAAVSIGCGDGTAPQPDGTYTLILSNALQDTLRGTASLVVFQSPTPRYGLRLEDSQKIGFSFAVVGDALRPVVGTYSIGPSAAPQTNPTILTEVCAEYPVPCHVSWGNRTAGSGTLRVTRSTPGAFVGTLEADLRTSDAYYANSTLHVSATFSASCAEGRIC